LAHPKTVGIKPFFVFLFLCSDYSDWLISTVIVTESLRGFRPFASAPAVWSELPAIQDGEPWIHPVAILSGQPYRLHPATVFRPVSMLEQ